MDDWSPNAVHIQSLFSKDCHVGYEEATLREAESQLGVRLPYVLREFYRSWGRCKGMTRRREMLLAPDELEIRDGLLLFCVENQGTGFWGVETSQLSADNPPVIWIFNDDCPPANEKTHESVSDFLDALTYMHAFAEGAKHGAYSVEICTEQHREQLRQHWTAIELNSKPWELAEWPAGRGWPLFIGDGVAFSCLWHVTIACYEAETLDQVADILKVSWKKRW